MAKLSKKGISTLLVLLVVVSLLSLTMFSCTIRMAQKDSTYIDMGKVHLLQLETPADDAPAMIVHTSVGDITAVLYPEVAPNYVAQFTELVERAIMTGRMFTRPSRAFIFGQAVRMQMAHWMTSWTRADRK